MKRMNFKAKLVAGKNDYIQKTLPMDVFVDNWEVDVNGDITWAVVRKSPNSCPFHVHKPSFTDIGIPVSKIGVT